ncbi:hypothetical protein A5320_16860 [Rheinheimera sp. SA_1]|nr:hypothetical protein A5320_16860 [Rheinheimera sp. SA_1]
MCDQRLWQPMLQTAAGEQLQQQFAIQHAAIWQQTDLSGMVATIAAPQAAHLVGFSMGGYLVLSHLLGLSSAEPLTHPPTKLQQVKSLVLIAASAGSLPAAEIQGRQQVLQWLSSHRYQGMSRKRLVEFVHSSQLQNPLVTEPLLAMDQELGHEVLQMQLSQTSLRPSLMDQLAQIRCPVLIIAGQDDRLVALAQLQQMAALIPDARLVVLPDSGHMLPLEQPAVIASELLAFYQRVVTKT